MRTVRLTVGFGVLPEPTFERNEDMDILEHALAQRIGGADGELVEALCKEIERLQKDAKRYRWLRDVGDATWRPFALREGYSAEMADKAIDAAMLKTPNV